MTDSRCSEKRQLARLLCDDYFSNCQLQHADLCYDFQAINFHRNGICLFGSRRLPRQSEFTLSFNYQYKHISDEIIEIIHLPCIALLRQETDVGNQYGIQFVVDAISPEVLSKLKKIENYLMAGESNGDRYGLFS